MYNFVGAKHHFMSREDNLFYIGILKIISKWTLSERRRGGHKENGSAEYCAIRNLASMGLV